MYLIWRAQLWVKGEGWVGWDNFFPLYTWDGSFPLLISLTHLQMSAPPVVPPSGKGEADPAAVEDLLPSDLFDFGGGDSTVRCTSLACRIGRAPTPS